MSDVDCLTACIIRASCFKTLEKLQYISDKKGFRVFLPHNLTRTNQIFYNLYIPSCIQECRRNSIRKNDF